MPSTVPTEPPEELLRAVMACDIPLPSLVPACRSATDNEQENDELVQLISRTVAAMGYPKMVHLLGQAVMQAPNNTPSSPTVRPVVRLRVCLVKILLMDVYLCTYMMFSLVEK